MYQELSSLNLRKTTKHIGPQSTSYDSETEIKKRLRTAKHADDINGTGAPIETDKYIKIVESVFGPCTYHDQCFTVCGVRHTQAADGIILDQDDYIATLRPIVSPELT